MEPRPEPILKDQSVVIIGAGLAGVRVAESLRQTGFAGPITLIGEEPHPPYDRPPLSKMVLTNVGGEDKIALLPAEDLAGLDVELLLGVRALELDRRERTVRLSDGRRVSYDQLVIATGSSVRTLPDFPPEREKVHYLRGLDDALALRQALSEPGHVAVIGAGVIGLEVAAAAVELGRTVTVIEAGDRVMGRAASTAVTDFITQRHRAAGVDLRLRTVVETIREASGGLELSLSDGSLLACRLIVVGVGVTPNDQLAREAGLLVEPGGIVVDGYGVSSDPLIRAAGEVALHYNGLHGRHDRQETWAHAASHGEHVGRALVSTTEVYHELGSYWTDQFDFTLNVFGAPVGDVDIVRGDPSSGKFLVFHLIGGKVAGVSGINAGRDLRGARRLIGVDQVIDPALLADPSASLSTLA